METETVEIGGELARVLNATARKRGVTLQEFVIHLLLQFVDEMDEDEGLDDEEDAEESE
jgi:hypothetical protein